MDAEFLIPIAMFAMIFGIVYISVTSKHRQRMAMIDKGMDPSNFMEKDHPFRTLRNGMFLAAAGIGLLIGRVLEPLFQKSPEDDNPVSYFIAIFICCGLSLIVHHFIVQKRQTN